MAQATYEDEATLTGYMNSGLLGPNAIATLSNIAREFGIELVEVKNLGGFFVKTYSFTLRGREDLVLHALNYLEQ